tara:strand:- start:30 stop:137 length:108 start_codon:yes stop_codon:yes gene_type:complete
MKETVNPINQENDCKCINEEFHIVEDANTKPINIA